MAGDVNDGAGEAKGSSLNRAAMVFLVVGALTVLVDLLVYRLLVALGVEVHVAKGLSFIAGTVFAYFANRLVTFRAPGGPKVFARFVALYAATLAANVGVNALALALLPATQFELMLGFLAATAVSATLNFVGMRYLVFSGATPRVAPQIGLLRHPDVLANAAFAVFISSVALLIRHYWDGLSVSDGIAQFMPMSLEGYRAVLQGSLPLYNFVQFSGTPLLETGYYPVLSPVFLLSAFIAEAIVGAPQMTWNLLVLFQFGLNGLAAYWFCRLVLDVDAAMALVAAISASLLGVVVFLSEWYYMASSAGFVLALLILVKRVVEGRGPLSPILLGVVAFLYLLSSNVQFLFYAAHFLLVGWVAFVACLKDRDGTTWVAAATRGLPGLAFAIALFLLLAGPLLLAVAAHADASMRESGKVALDKYFWIYLDWREALRFTGWPHGGPGPVFWRTPFVYHVGPASVLGLLLLGPLLAAVALRRLRWAAGDIALALALLASVMWAGLLSLGPDGKLGALLYHLPPYNWFRHAIKWAVFFQIFACVLGVYALARAIRLAPSPAIRTALRGGVLALTIAASVQFITVTRNPQRLTGDTLPLPAPTFAGAPGYRHVGVWPGGPTYETDMSGRLLGWDYASLWRIPTIAGYEPMARQENLQWSQGMWHPGYYQSIAGVDYAALAERGVRYLWTPAGSAERVVSELAAAHPGLRPRLAGEDFGGATRIVEIEARPLVYGPDGAPANAIRIDPHRVVATVNVSAPGPVAFNWVRNPGLTVHMGGRRLPVASDAAGRVVVTAPEAGVHEFVLSYRPRYLPWMLGGWFVALLMAAAAFHPRLRFLVFKRPAPSP